MPRHLPTTPFHHQSASSLLPFTDSTRFHPFRHTCLSDAPGLSSGSMLVCRRSTIMPDLDRFSSSSAMATHQRAAWPLAAWVSRRQPRIGESCPDLGPKRRFSLDWGLRFEIRHFQGRNPDLPVARCLAEPPHQAISSRAEPPKACDEVNDLWLACVEPVRTVLVRVVSVRPKLVQTDLVPYCQLGQINHYLNRAIDSSIFQIGFKSLMMVPGLDEPWDPGEGHFYGIVKIGW